MKTLDLSALQDPGLFKDKVPANLSQSNYTGWSPKGLPRPKTSSVLAPCEPFSSYYRSMYRSSLPINSTTENLCGHRPVSPYRRWSVWSRICAFSSLREAHASTTGLRDEHPFGIEQADIESPSRRDWFGNQQFVRYLLLVLLEPEWPAIQAVRSSGMSWMGDNDDKVKRNLYEVLGKVFTLESRSWRRGHVRSSLSMVHHEKSPYQQEAR